MLTRQVRFLDMPLVRATQSSAKTILSHFHYCLKGQQPFRKEFDWTSAKTRRMARLDAEQSNFMAAYRDRVSQKGELSFVHLRTRPLTDETVAVFTNVNHSDSYEAKYYFTSQLFDADWVPRETLEHSPVVERT